MRLFSFLSSNSNQWSVWRRWLLSRIWEQRPDCKALEYSQGKRWIHVHFKIYFLIDAAEISLEEENVSFTMSV